MSTSKSASAEKPPRIKGLVKRCRSFKEDFLSRLARNRSIGKDDPSMAGQGRSGSGGRRRKGQVHSEGTSPVPPGSSNSSGRRGDTPDSSSQVTISHKLKEAYLTLSFVESLIQKNCVDLLGGSSNVMLDLMGNLLAEIKKTSISDSPSYQSAISLMKSALTEFLTAVDALLLLKDKNDSTQQKLYFEKVLETLNQARDALTKLKSLIEAKENGHAHAVGHNTGCGGYSGSTPALLTSTPTSSISGGPTLCPKLSHSPGSRSTGGESNSQSHDTGFSSEDKRPPLPPKLKQWTARSFDHYTSSPPTTSPVHRQRFSEQQRRDHRELALSAAENSASLLNQWLEESSLGSQFAVRNRRQSASSSSNHQSYQSQTTMNVDTVDSFGCPANWTDSAIFLSSSNRTSGSVTSSKIQANMVAPAVGHGPNNNSNSLSSQQRYDSTSQYSEPTSSGNHLQPNNRKLRTFSDSFYGRANANQSDGDSDPDDDDDDGSTDNINLLHDARSHHTEGTSHCSQSLSIDSSLDNLLLVDSNSTRSAGMSPNSQRISVSSNTTNTQSPLLLAGSNSGLLSGNFDQDDVFMNENDNRERLVIVQQEQDDDDVPPELPKKVRQTNFAARHFIIGSHAQAHGHSYSIDVGGTFNGSSAGGRCPSPYDNVDAETFESIDPTTNLPSHQYQQYSNSTSRQFMSYSESRNTLVGVAGAIGNSGSSGDTPFDEKPPLPPKKKHSITAYVELMHSFDVQNYHVVPHLHQSHHQRQHHSLYNHKPLPTLQSTSSNGDPHPGPGTSAQPHGSNTCPNSYQHFSSFSSTATSVFGPTSEEDTNTVISDSENHHRHPPPLRDQHTYSPSQYPYQQIINPTNTSSFESDTNQQISNSNSSLSHCSNNNNLSSNDTKPPMLPPKKPKQSTLVNQPACEPVHFDINEVTSHLNAPSTCNVNVPRQLELHYDQSLLAAELAQDLASPTGRSSIMSIPSLGPAQSVSSPMHSDTMENLAVIPHDEDQYHETLYLLDVVDMLTKNDTSQMVKGSTSEGPEVKGADPLILLIYAASPYLDDAKFREVFLLTYRTFLPPLDAINLLWKRFQYFEKRMSDRTYVLHARSTLDLFVDVINSLTPMDMEDSLVPKIRECIYYLINSGELTSALKARRGLIVKCEVRHKLLSPKPAPVTLAVSVESNSLLHWSATSTAQQMTLLDSELFRHLEPAELLLWAREQSEDFCPALNNFTDHFNKVSYWARTRVLLCSNSRERNRTMKKLIEVMRKLREYNNFNSLLAVLAALDSAPIRRLGFSKRLTEALKPHAALTDSSGSFRTYRQALSESKPPCIPYIGLVLQDLTFVHIGNADFLADGKVNWIKRWQQWIVLEPIRRFHACQYGFTKNDALLAFLNNFDESLNDDDLWQLSEAIKPRGKN